MSHVKRLSRFGLLLLLFAAVSGWAMRLSVESSAPLHAQSGTPITQLLSISPQGVPGNNDSLFPAISANGQVIAFMSMASNLVADDANIFSDVFVRDLVTGVTTRISVAADGSEADNGSGNSEPPALSADGRYIAYVSSATNLVTGDTNELADVFVYDRQSAQTVRVSVSTNGGQGDWPSSHVSISATGRYVAFVTRAALVAEDTNNLADVYVHDRDADADGIFDEAGARATRRVSIASDGTQGDAAADFNRTGLSDDGRYVVFASRASNLVEGDNNIYTDIFVHDRDADGDGLFDEAGAIRTRRISLGLDNAEPNGMSYDSAISGDGRYVAFWSDAGNLVKGDILTCPQGNCQDVFVVDRDVDGDGLFDEEGDVSTSLASSSAAGVRGDNPSYLPQMADNGVVAFYASAQDLVPDDSAWVDIFVKDVKTGAILRASVSADNQAANGNSFLPDISADGNRVVFESNATNLVAGESSFYRQIYLFNRQGELPTPTATPTATPTPTRVPVETPTGQPGAPSWQVTTLDVRGYVGQNADLTLDANGYPHIAYSGDYGSTSELRYTWWDGFAWQLEVLEEATATGEYPSIDIGPNGQPRISYYHRSDTALRYAVRGSDGTWQTHTVDSNNDRGRYSSLALDPVSGIADIVYYEREGTRLLHVRGAPGQWTYFEVDDSGDVGEDASLARGSNALLGAAYYDRTTGALRYAQWNESTRAWTATVVDDEDNAGSYPSLAFDSLGRPHIAYLTTANLNRYTLKYAVRTGAQWTIRTVDTNVEPDEIELLIGAQDLPVIAFRKGSIRLARLKEDVWNFELVQGGVDRGESLSVARDAVNDREHLVYEDGRYSDLSYAVWNTAWQTRTVGSGDRPTLALRNGRPTVLYRRADQTLQRASGQSGATWGQSSVRAAVGESSNPVVLDANGGQHIAFYEPGRRAIVYASFIDNAWQFEDAAILPTDAIFQPNLRLVFRGGEPHLLYTYYDGTVSMHIAYRANGSWQTSTHPSPRALGGEPNFDALVLDNGNIAISYWDAANNDLRLILWDGANWLDSLIDTGPEDAEVGEFNAIARGIEMVGDTPVETLAIAYYDRTHRSIRYAHSATGIWQSRELIPDVGSVSGLDLAVAGDTYALPFIVFTTQDFITQDGNLYLAFSNNNLQTVTLETIAQDAALYAAQPSLVHDNQPRIVYRNGAGQIVYTFPTARLSIPAPVHNDGGASVGVLYGAGLDLPVCFYLLLQPATTRSTVFETLAATILPDGQVMGGLTDRFRASRGGQHYLGLAAQHAQEMATIVRGDPVLLWDGHRVMQNFMPGLEAWVSGQGDEVIVTQQMADDALDIWQRIAAQAGPELSAAINAELAATNNLQNFVGESFDQWAEEIGVGNGEIELYLPVVSR